jgi:hypothetical protein
VKVQCLCRSRFAGFGLRRAGDAVEAGVDAMPVVPGHVRVRRAAAASLTRKSTVRLGGSFPLWVCGMGRTGRYSRESLPFG